MTFSEESKAELYAELTDKRVEEIVYMANKGNAEEVVILTRKLDDRTEELAAMTEATNMRNGAVLMAGAPNQAPSPETSRSLDKAAAPVPSEVPMLAASAPTDVVTAAGGSGVGNATGKSDDPGAVPGAPAPTAIRPFVVPGPENSADDSKSNNARTANSNFSNKETKLRTLLSDYAVKHPAKLREALDKLPEPARQEVLRSIAVTAANYEKALRSFDNAK